MCLGRAYMRRMAKPLVSDELWAVVAPLLPPERPSPKGGRPRVADRAALTGILFVLKSGIPWEMLPQEMGCGSGMTCWRRLRDWQEAGRLGTAPPRAARPARRGQRDRLEPLLAGQRQRPGQKGGELHRPEPDRSRQAGHEAPRHRRRRRHPARRSCSPPRQRPRQPAFRAAARRRAADPAVRRAGRGSGPSKLHADKAYDYRRCRRACRKRGASPLASPARGRSSERLGRHRWVVERTLAWLARFRRLTIRYERRADILLEPSTSSPPA